MQSTIPEVKVPWDAEALKGHDCQHCACYFETSHAENPNEFQGFCRRQPAMPTQSRVQVPRKDPKTGQPVIKDGQVVMNNEVVIGFLYAPTQRQGTCFEGYRPLGTLPGERPMDAKTKDVLLTLIHSAQGLLSPDVKDTLRQALNGQ